MAMLSCYFFQMNRGPCPQHPNAGSEMGSGGFNPSLSCYEIFDEKLRVLFAEHHWSCDTPNASLKSFRFGCVFILVQKEIMSRYVMPISRKEFSMPQHFPSWKKSLYHSICPGRASPCYRIAPRSLPEGRRILQQRQFANTNDQQPVARSPKPCWRKEAV